jgi:hypothetical protein
MKLTDTIKGFKMILMEMDEVWIRVLYAGAITEITQK